MKFFVASLITCASLIACGGKQASPPDQIDNTRALLTGAALQQDLDSFRSSNGLPGVAAVLVDQDKIEIATSGQRRIDTPAALQINDKMQMGSLTKAMTATLVARLVEQKKLRWNSSLSELFPAWRTQMQSDYLQVTVEQLLRHRSGLQTDIEGADLQFLQTRLTGDAIKDRTSIGLWALQQKPAYSQKTSNYSNIGYLIVGLIAEAVGGDTYENLMQKEVFTPLKIDARFGFPEDMAPGTPFGHTYNITKWQVVSDAPLRHLSIFAISAAGGVSLSMGDYGKFLREHLQGLQGRSTFLSKESFQMMHTPVDQFGLGWLVTNIPDIGAVSSHTGSFDSYFTSAVIVPAQNRALNLACNCASPIANNLVEVHSGKLIFPQAK